VRAERAFLAELGSGCSLPVGAYATLAGDRMVLDGLIASIDGRVVLRAGIQGSVSDPEALGAELAHSLLDRSAGRSLLAVDGAGLR
jgi:hydroxymethylbilane synthase